MTDRPPRSDVDQDSEARQHTLLSLRVLSRWKYRSIDALAELGAACLVSDAL
jgi:hypothetical protein